MADGASLKRTREIVIKTLRELRRTERRELRRQRMRRRMGLKYFVVERQSSGPMMIDLSGIKVDPLWDTTSAGYADLDIARPLKVNRRESLGQMWIIGHDYDSIRIAIVLVVDADEKAWLVPYGGTPFPASVAGWNSLMSSVGPRFAKNRGGLWQGSG